ncbi:hypothetical protein L3Q82_004682 [Scortum barcoo]|uniref:Uncharacterized protein n=1 Tax=Scortum barcoo TaxID=214431 RepID=A0ACB8VH91_9TELE|nr:hypothetical protein L3Q82_004682 [Scortum barcoo]
MSGGSGDKGQDDGVRDDHGQLPATRGQAMLLIACGYHVKMFVLMAALKERAAKPSQMLVSAGIGGVHLAVSPELCLCPSVNPEAGRVEGVRRRDSGRRRGPGGGFGPRPVAAAKAGTSGGRRPASAETRRLWRPAGVGGVPRRTLAGGGDVAEDPPARRRQVRQNSSGGGGEARRGWNLGRPMAAKARTSEAAGGGGGGRRPSGWTVEAEPRPSGRRQAAKTGTWEAAKARGDPPLVAAAAKVAGPFWRPTAKALRPGGDRSLEARRRRRDGTLGGRPPVARRSPEPSGTGGESVQAKGVGGTERPVDGKSPETAEVREECRRGRPTEAAKFGRSV